MKVIQLENAFMFQFGKRKGEVAQMTTYSLEQLGWAILEIAKDPEMWVLSFANVVVPVEELNETEEEKALLN